MYFIVVMQSKIISNGIMSRDLLPVVHQRCKMTPEPVGETLHQ